MKRRVPAHGYTIVEVLIFLAVTSFLFIAVVGTLGAQQRRTEFALAAREFDSQMQDIINDVATGYYYNTGNIACVANAGGGVTLSTSGSDQQGSNADCIFLGRTVQFTDTDTYRVYTVVGRRLDQNTGQPVASYSEAHPEAIANNGSGSEPDATEERKIPGGLEVRSVTTDSGLISMVGFMTALDKYATTANGTLGSTSIAVDAVAFPGGGTLNGSSTDHNSSINRISSLGSSGPDTNPDGGIIVCLDNGGNQRAELTIGSNGRQLTTNTVISAGSCP